MAFAQDRTILVEPLQGILLLPLDTNLSQPVGECVFIHLLIVSVPVAAMDGE